MVTVVASGGVGTGVPLEITSYVGRQRELLEARELLGGARLLTLIGPGGVGKTRLAARLAMGVRGQFPDGVCFVALAELRDPGLLPILIAGRLGLREQMARSTIEVLLDYLRDRCVLLVLDNCEHLVDAVAELVGQVMDTGSSTVVLATSRQSLNLPGEQVFPLPPFAVPDEHAAASELAECDAVKLFADRAAAVQPTFQVTSANAVDIAAVCRYLDGVPLAIELAAARSRALSVEQISERLSLRLPVLGAGLRTAPRRHQTLEATIDWSYELCSRSEQLVWQRVSVFSGSFDLAAAEHVCGGSDVPVDEVIDVVDGLLDKSVLIRGENQGRVRYRLLETVRQYGQRRLRDAGDWPRVARLHRDWYADMARGFGVEWVSAEQVAWGDKLRGDHANLRVAFEFCLSQPGEAVVLARMVLAIREYWVLAGLVSEAGMWLARAMPELPPDVPEWGQCRWLAGMAAILTGDPARAEKLLGEAAEFAESSGDEVLVAQLADATGSAFVWRGDHAKAVEPLRAAVATLRAHRVVDDQLHAMWMLGLAESYTADTAAARRTLDEGLAISVGRGEIYYQGWLLDALAQAEMIDGDLDAAESAALRALRLEHELGNMFAIALTTTLLALVALRQQRFTRAASLFGAADSTWTAIGSSPDVIYGDRYRRNMAKTAAALGDAGYRAAFAAGRALSRAAALRFALGEKEAVPVAPEAAAPVLTKRETEVAGLIAEGMTNREIAAKLFIALRTAETHVDRILTKLDFNNRAQIAAWVAGRDGQ